MTIKLLYVTEDNVSFESLNAARFYELLQNCPDVYLENYKLKRLAEYLAEEIPLFTLKGEPQNQSAYYISSREAIEAQLSSEDIPE
jgi:hypothetical protein